MEAGRELDTLIAARVMGYTPVTSLGGDYRCEHDGKVFAAPPYSTSTALAVDDVSGVMAGYGLRLSLDRWGGEPWWAEFADEGWEHGGQATSKTAAHAICLAAIAALDDLGR